MNKLDININNIYAVGDIHGFFGSLISLIKQYKITDTGIIVCGDCGIGFNKLDETKKRLKKLNDVCRKNNVTIVMFRGNHDDPNFFTYGKITSNIILVPDYTVINGTILCVGGATSIDRKYRMQVKNNLCMEYLKYHPYCTMDEANENTSNLYWENELPVYDEGKLNEIKESGINITTVCTHTCPTFCDPLTKDGIKEWIKVDPGLDACIKEERDVMDKLYNKLLNDGHTINDWIYGHYHRHHMQFINNIKFMMLDAVVYDGGNVDWCKIKCE